MRPHTCVRPLGTRRAGDPAEFAEGASTERTGRYANPKPGVDTLIQRLTDPDGRDARPRAMRAMMSADKQQRQRGATILKSSAAI